MVRNYKFYGKEETKPVIISYEFEPPFYDNLDEELKMQYGEDLTFVKEINHREKVIRIHSAYDSGKGTLYIPPAKRKKRRTNFKKKVFQIFSEKDSDFLEIKNEVQFENDFDENFILIFHKEKIEVFRDARFRNGSVMGYRLTIIDNTPEAAFLFLKRNKHYPYFYKFLK